MYRYESDINIVAIVITYNRIDMLKRCIECIKASDSKADILIVDNASTDGTKDYCLSLGEQIIYRRLEHNTGGAGGYNFGISEAYAMGYKYFWLMDDDTFVEHDALTKLLEASGRLRGNYGFLSSYAEWIDGKPCVMNYHHIIRKWQQEKDLLSDGLLRIQGATFVSFFVNRETVTNVGLPIKEYFIWGDDTEYSRRISSKYPSYLVFTSKVLHNMNSNEASDLANMTDVSRIDRMFYSIRNDICTYKRISFYEFLRYGFWLFKQFIQILFKKNSHKLLKLKILFKGFFAGLLFAPQIERV